MKNLTLARHVILSRLTDCEQECALAGGYLGELERRYHGQPDPNDPEVRAAFAAYVVAQSAEIRCRRALVRVGRKIKDAAKLKSARRHAA